MKKFICFLTFVLMGVLAIPLSYAEDNVDEAPSDYKEVPYNCAEEVYAEQSAIDSTVKKAIAECHNERGLGTKLGIIFHKEKNIWEEQDDETKTIRVWTMTNLICDKGHSFSENTGLCEGSSTEAEQQPAEKVAEKKKAAAPAKKAAQQQKPAAAKKTFKDEFKEGCNNFPKEMEKEGVQIDSTLSSDGTQCTVKSDRSIDRNDLLLAISDLKDDIGSCSNPEYTATNTYSITCKNGDFSGKISFYFAQITCQDNHTFDSANGRCNENQTCENNSYNKSGARSECRAAVTVDISTLLNNAAPNQKNLSILSVSDQAEIQSKFENYKKQVGSDGTARTYLKYDMVMKCCGKESLDDDEYAKYQSNQNPEQMVAEKNSSEVTSEAETKNDEEAFRAAANNIVKAYNKRIAELAQNN